MITSNGRKKRKKFQACSIISVNYWLPVMIVVKLIIQREGYGSVLWYGTKKNGVWRVSIPEAWVHLTLKKRTKNSSPWCLLLWLFKLIASVSFFLHRLHLTKYLGELCMEGVLSRGLGLSRALILRNIGSSAVAQGPRMNIGSSTVLAMAYTSAGHNHGHGLWL